ncbi:alpha/beta fold hydrolase [Nocardiopsis sp. FIRDI 009]|uniref:alpha/beta fold hydrolase n=1 Tax=Nocardiopsis sp. FIRDI 009 TaxID=714197 RepID=UPI001E299C38|nr:alpha/beta fold hydrolase [Nocardiopsis sp. FIRDI 009]
MSVLVGALTLTLVAASPAAADPTDPLAEFHGQEVVWTPCEEPILAGLECAEVEAPLDYARPDGARVTIAISRRRATDPERRRGILLTNPGGPGGTGRVLPVTPDPDRGIGFGLGGERIAEVYDVIGMDPRGSGASSPRLDCGVDDIGLSSPPRPDDGDFSGITRAAITAERACDRADGDVRPFMTTANTARDMDVIRAALGEDGLNYLGYSYGTYLGAVYGSLFPDRLDRSVLDSAVRPEGFWRGVFTQMAPAYTRNVERYTPWVAQHDDVYGLGSTSAEVLAAFEETSRSLERAPRTDVPGYPDGYAFTNDDFDFLVGQVARFQGQWDVTTGLLAHFAHDIPFPPTAAPTTQEPDYQVSNPSLTIAVICEAEWPGRLSRYYADMREVREAHPFGVGAAWHAPTPCSFTSDDPVEPLVELERDGYPVGLVVAGEFDTQTPHASGVAMSERLGHRLVTVTDEGGHAFYGMPGMSCVTDAVDAYLVDGAAPEDVTCAGLPRPAAAADQPLAAAEITALLSEAREAARGGLPIPTPLR